MSGDRTTAKIGILTVSDRAARGEYEDRGGPAIRVYLDEVLSCRFEPVARLVSDDQPLIEAALRELCQAQQCCLVITTGGTGPAARDVTPEAPGLVGEGADGHIVAASCGHLRRRPDCESAGAAPGHPRMPGRGFPRDPLLHRSTRGTVSDHE
jgi:hypothetical protein